MTTYAAVKGRARSPAPAQPRATSTQTELPDTELEAIDANRHFIHDHMPELIPVIKSYIAAGFDVVGWRNIQNCRLLSNAEQGE